MGRVQEEMIVLFAAITGGIDWRETLMTLRQVSSGSWTWYSTVFFWYVAVMQLGVMNVVVATFVAHTTEISAKDQHLIIETELGRMHEYMAKVQVFFKEADLDKDGLLSWEEFEEHMTNAKVKAFFQALELDVFHAHKLFDLLDQDKDNSVNLEEFLEGCMRLRGGAKNVD